MNKCLLLIFISFSFTSLFAQSDFIQLKKHERVIQTWFKDNDITLQLKNGSWLTASIYKIEKDSLFLKPYDVVYYTRGHGINAKDTIFYPSRAISFNNINAFPKPDEGSGLIKSGLLFKAGGGGFLLLNVINTLSNNEPVFGSDNLPKIGIATGVLAVGFALSLSHKTTYMVGKKYHIEYISAKPSS